MWNLSFLATGIPRPHQWLLMGVQACRLRGLKRLKGFKPLQLVFLSNRHPKATSMASYGRPSLPLAGLKRFTGFKPLQLAKASRNAQPRRQKLPQGQIHRFFWAVQPAVRQAFAANRHQGHINGFLWASKPAVCQPLNP